MRTKLIALDEIFEKGDLIKINATGEVFTYESSAYVANFRSLLILNVQGNLIECRGLICMNDVTKVDNKG